MAAIERGDGLSPVTLSGNRFTPKDVQDMNEQWCTAFQDSQVDGLRSAAIEPPDLPADPETRQRDLGLIAETPVNLGVRHVEDMAP